MEFRKRFAMQVRSDSAIALDKLVNKGMYQDNQTVGKYTELFNMHNMRLIGEGVLLLAAQCQYYLKGLQIDLKAECLMDDSGQDWVDLSSVWMLRPVRCRSRPGPSTTSVPGLQLQMWICGRTRPKRVNVLMLPLLPLMSGLRTKDAPRAVRDARATSTVDAMVVAIAGSALRRLAALVVDSG